MFSMTSAQSTKMNIDAGAAAGNKDEKKVDEQLYSRQLYVLGHEGLTACICFSCVETLMGRCSRTVAQRRLTSGRVLIVGLRGLGAEIGNVSFFLLGFADSVSCWVFCCSAKNVILAGAGYVGLLDNDKVELADLGAQVHESHTVLSTTLYPLIRASCYCSSASTRSRSDRFARKHLLPGWLLSTRTSRLKL